MFEKRTALAGRFEGKSEARGGALARAGFTDDGHRVPWVNPLLEGPAPADECWQSVLVVASFTVQLANQGIPMPLDPLAEPIGEALGLFMHLGNRRR